MEVEIWFKSDYMESLDLHFLTKHLLLIENICIKRKKWGIVFLSNGKNRPV